MDERDWSKEVYDEIQTKFANFLKKECQYAAKDLFFLPLSGFTGLNVIEPLSKTVCPWYDGPSLIQILDNMKPPERNEVAPLRVPVTDRYKEMGLLQITGKIEAGSVSKGQSVMLMPNKNIFKVSQLCVDDTLVKKAGPGENVRIGVQGIEETDVSTGNIICDPNQPITAVSDFVAQLVIVELLPTNQLFTAGYEAVMHIHTSVRDITVGELLSEIDKKTKKPTKRPPKFVKAGAVVTARLQSHPPVCLELFENYAQLGRFTLRDKGKTIAIGKVIKINN